MLYCICIAERKFQLWWKGGQKKLASFPGRKIAPHQEVIEACHSNQLEQLCDDLLQDGFLHVVALQTFPNLVEEVQNVIHAVRWLTVAIQDAV